MQQWGADQPAAHNSWTLKEFGGGYYYILSALADGKTYYLNSVGEADGSNIEIRTNNKSSSHLFKFVKNPDGTYTILTRTSKDQAAVEVANAEKSSGANVQQWTVNGNACQKWNAVAFTTTTTATTATTTTTTTTTATVTTTKITSATSVSATTVPSSTTAITEEPPAISGDINADFECNPLAAPFVEEVIKQLQAGETPEKEVYMTEHWFVNEDVLSTINVNGEDQDLTVVTKEIVDAQY